MDTLHQAPPRADPGALRTPDPLRSEPYRILFPMGVAGAVIGIGIWIPCWFWPGSVAYPGQEHAVILIHVFLLCFVLGSLATILPGTLGVRPLDGVSFALLPLLLAGTMVSALSASPSSAQVCHLLALAVFLAFAVRRYPERRANPPADSLFIAAALVADLAGTVLKLGALTGILGDASSRAGGLLQYQAFPLLLILGTGGFLLPRPSAAGGVDPGRMRAESGSGPATPAFLCALFLGSFLLEILAAAKGYGSGGLRAAYALRAGIWAWFLFNDLRIQKGPGTLPPHLRSARISMVVIGAGLLMPVFRPRDLLAWEHVIFLSGYLRLTLSMASHVSAAHAGRLPILLLHGRKVRVYGMLIVLSMVTRLAVRFWPAGRSLQLAVAASLALFAIYIWGRIFIPLLRVYPGD